MTVARAVAFFVLVLPCLGYAQAENPFTGASGGRQDEAPRVQQNLAPAFIQKGYVYISRVQRDLHARMSTFARRLANAPSIGIVVMLLGVGFGYGVVHSLGPGHGKLFTVSYVVSQSASLRKGLVFGTGYAFIHAGSAIVLVLALYYVLQQTVYAAVEDFSYSIRLISYALIACIGAALLSGHLRALFRRAGAPPVRNNFFSRKPLAAALSVGIVPCTGTVILMLFFISLEMPWFGILVALSMAGGMAVTISGIAAAASISRTSIELSFPDTRPVKKYISAICEIGAALAIFGMGCFLFLVSLK